jgi:hypothetical protein
MSLALAGEGENLRLTCKLRKKESPEEILEWTFLDTPGVDPVVSGADSGPPYLGTTEHLNLEVGELAASDGWLEAFLDNFGVDYARPFHVIDDFDDGGRWNGMGCLTETEWSAEVVDGELTMRGRHSLEPNRRCPFYVWPHRFEDGETVEFKVDVVRVEGMGEPFIDFAGSRVPWISGFEPSYGVRLSIGWMALGKWQYLNEDYEMVGGICAARQRPDWEGPIVLSLILRRAGETWYVTGKVARRDHPDEALELTFVDGPGIDPMRRDDIDIDPGPPPSRAGYFVNVTVDQNEEYPEFEGDPIEVVLDNFECSAETAPFPLLEIERRGSQTHLFWQPFTPLNKAVPLPDGDWIFTEGPEYDLVWADSPTGPWQPWTGNINNRAVATLDREHQQVSS